MLIQCQIYVKNINFCKIDVEGEEKNVLLGYNFENYRSEVFCIESTKTGTMISCYELSEEILLINNYLFAFNRKILSDK